MAKLYDKGPLPVTAEDLLTAIDAFLRTCRSPAVLEAGEDPIALEPSTSALELRSGHVWLEVWHEHRSLARRLTGIETSAPGSLQCTVHRFGNKRGHLTFIDLDRPQSAQKTLVARRQGNAEQFRRMLSRQFPGWTIDSLSSAMDLQRSFSPVFPRARLSRGLQQIAAMMCPDEASESTLLTFALLWIDHLRSQRGTSRGHAPPRLCLFLPETAGCLTAQRLRWLDCNALRPVLFRFNEHGSAGEVDPADLGNLDTRVSDRFAAPALTQSTRTLLASLEPIQDVGVCPEITGALSIRFRGVEFARIENNRVALGLEHKHDLSAAQYGQVASFAHQLQMLPAATESRTESWLETAVRRHLPRIHPSMRLEPVHGQVLTFSGSDRDMIDLLATTDTGQLAVLELKASEDIHLPLQGLDYWMRIRWHAQRGELTHLFPGVALAQIAPTLHFVAPALSFHSANSTVLRYFSPDVCVERIGINSDWKRDFRVVSRLRGADAPQSHT